VVVMVVVGSSGSDGKSSGALLIMAITVVLVVVVLVVVVVVLVTMVVLVVACWKVESSLRHCPAIDKSTKQKLKDDTHISAKAVTLSFFGRSKIQLASWAPPIFLECRRKQP
jgi:flagellar basal body-associated protein FliL